MLVVATGERTEFARIATTIGSVPKTDFAGGIRRFGYLMTQIMLVIVILVFFLTCSWRGRRSTCCSSRWRRRSA